MITLKAARGIVFAGIVSLALVGCTNTPLNEDANASNAAAASASAKPEAPAAAAPTAPAAKVAQVEVKSGAASVLAPAESVSRLVYFAFDSYAISDEYTGVIAAHASFLKANANASVSIEGHTDELGSREYNIALGQQRAEAVRRALALLGVAESQIEAVSFGEEKAAVPGADAASRAKNRRAFFNYR
jgi:peptidoglycan-associated lipoprotein